MNRYVPLLKYLGFLLFVFQALRVLFVFVNHEAFVEVQVIEVIQAGLYGLRLDLAITAILGFVFLLYLILRQIIQISLITILFNIIQVIFIILIAVLYVADMFLYPFWKTRIDQTILKYFNDPFIMLASLTIWQIIGFALVFVAVLSFLLYIDYKLIRVHMLENRRFNFYSFLLGFFFYLPLIIMARGGLQTVPINHSNVYFSKNIVVNHTALNVVWNFFYSINKASGLKNTYRFTASANAQRIINEYSPIQVRVPKSKPLLRIERPNIVLILWESFTAKLVKQLGAKNTYTPGFSSLIHQGLFFEHFYANGSRSDQGIAAVFSGAYALPQKSIIFEPSKAEKLPHLLKDLNLSGYHTAFYYGGELNFANMNTYFLNAQIDELVSGHDFDAKDWNSKWGVHDHIVLERFTRDVLQESQRPFFKSVFTLTSHEPFEIPTTYKYGEQTEEQKFLSTHYYTDSAIFRFVETFKKTPVWDSTLVIIMADHGHLLPKHPSGYYAPEKFHIPMLWLGGALAVQDSVCSTYSSQVDLPFTLLNQLGIDAGHYALSNSLFRSDSNDFAQYMFNNGFGIVNRSGHLLYDYNQNKPISSTIRQADQIQLLGKSITQQSFENYLEK